MPDTVLSPVPMKKITHNRLCLKEADIQVKEGMTEKKKEREKMHK